MLLSQFSFNISSCFSWSDSPFYVATRLTPRTSSRVAWSLAVHLRWTSLPGGLDMITRIFLDSFARSMTKYVSGTARGSRVTPIRTYQDISGNYKPVRQEKNHMLNRDHLDNKLPEENSLRNNIYSRKRNGRLIFSKNALRRTIVCKQNL